MRKAFTLIELLAVIMIMGLLGTAAVGGYRAMQRGMEERGVMQNANAVIRSAYQRAQIDRQPVAIFFWNETLRGRTSEENEVVVGRAVAVRRHGRLSNVFGNKLIDEFADLNLTYPVQGEEDGNSSTGNDTMYLYPMDNLRNLASNSSLPRSLVRSKVVREDEDAMFLSGPKSETTGGKDKTGSNEIPGYAFVLEEAGSGIDWKAGMAYGFEFISVQLPHGYIFGSNYSSSTDDPVRSAGTIVFKAGVNTGSGMTTGGNVGRDKITIYSLRPDGAMLKAQQVGTTDSPEERLK